METEVSLSFSQGLSTCPYIELNDSSAYYKIVLMICVLILSSSLRGNKRR
jgi:hypothetical protein